MGARTSRPTSSKDDGSGASSSAVGTSQGTPSARSSRKRRRVDADEQASSGESSPRQSKKRRRTSLSKYLGFDKVWNRCAEGVAFAFAIFYVCSVQTLARKGFRLAELSETEVNDMLESLISALHSCQSKHTPVLKLGWRLLFILSNKCSEETVSKIWDHSGNTSSEVHIIAAAMHTHCENLAIQLLGFRALRQLIASEEHKSSWDDVLEANGVSICVQAMRTHSNNEVLQGVAISFLSAMMLLDGTDRLRTEICDGKIHLTRFESKPPPAEFCQLNGTELTVAAMRTFEDSAHFLQTAYCLLYVVGFEKICEPRSSTLGRQIGDIVLESMERHSDWPNLVKEGIAVLFELVDREALSDWKRVPKMILKVFDIWMGNDDIMMRNILLLRKLIQSHPEEPEGFIRALVRVMLRCSAVEIDPATIRLIVQVCAALRDLILERALTRKVKDTMLREGVVEYIVLLSPKCSEFREADELRRLMAWILVEMWDHQGPDERTAITAFGGNVSVIGPLIFSGARNGGLE